MDQHITQVKSRHKRNTQ